MYFKPLVSASRLMALSTAALMTASAFAASAQDVNTRNPSAGSVFHTFNADSAYWVQTFTAPAAAVSLNNFSVWVGGGSETSNQFRTRLYNLTTNSAELFDVFSYGPGGAPQEYSFSVGLAANASDVFAVYLNYYGSGADFQIQSQLTDTYDGGTGYYSYDGSRLDHDFEHDFDFTADFDVEATPEPASLLLLATGLLGIIGVARRKAR